MEPEYEQLKLSAISLKNVMCAPHGMQPSFVPTFKSADVVFGYNIAAPDKWQRSMTVFHGRGFLQDISHSGRAASGGIVVLAYDQTTSELETLVACYLVYRGGCDYSRSSGQ